MRNENIFSAGQVARYCGVTNTTVISWIRQGHIKAYPTVGGHFRVRQADLVVFMKKFHMTLPDDLRNARVLVVDDDGRILKTIKESLSAEPSIDVTTASDGYEACILAGDVKPDVMILDLVLPGMDGFEVCRHLKANPSTHAIRIIAVSGTTDEEMVTKILRCGAERFLPKPLNLKKLMDFVMGAAG